MSLNYTLKIGDYNVESFHVGELNVVKIYKGDVLIYEKLEPGPIEDLDEMVRLAIASKDIQRCQEVGAYVEEQTRDTFETKYRYAAAKTAQELIDVNPSDFVKEDEFQYKVISGPLSYEIVDVNMMSLEEFSNGSFPLFFTNCKLFYSPVPSLTTLGTVFSTGPIETFLTELPNLETAYEAFKNCNNLTTFNIDMPKLSIAKFMFMYCENLKSFSSHTPLLREGHSMFMGCLDLSSIWLDTSSLTYCDLMFNRCESIYEINIDFPNAIEANKMFANCSALTSIDSDMHSLLNGSSMFMGCGNLEDVLLNINSLLNANGMFSTCASLLSYLIDTPHLTNSTGMFDGCSLLQSFSSNIRDLLSAGMMFYHCYSLNFVEPKNVKSKKALDEMILSLPDVSSSEENHVFLFTYFNDDGSEDYLEASTLKTASDTLNEIGWKCIYSLTNGNNKYENDTNFVNWNIDTPSLTTAERMFYNSNKLESFTADLSSLTSGYEMFLGCTLLSHFSSNLSSLTDGSNMFTDCCLDADSVINIANTLNRNVSNSPRIDIGIGDRQLTSNEITALNSLISKWTVYINGSLYSYTIPIPIPDSNDNHN